MEPKQIILEQLWFYVHILRDKIKTNCLKQKQNNPPLQNMKIKMSFCTSFSNIIIFFNFVKVVRAMYKLYDMNKNNS